MGPMISEISAGSVELLQPDVPEFEARAVVLQADVPLAGPALQLLVGAHVGVDHGLAVQRHGHLVALAADPQGVPLAGLPLGGLGRGDDPVDRRRVLERLDVPVHLGIVVEDLDLHADLGRASFAGGADEDAAVAVLGTVVLDLQLEVAVLLAGREPSALAALADDLPVLPGPAVRAPADRLPA